MPPTYLDYAPRCRGRVVPRGDEWREYERRKAALPPDLTPDQYEQACRDIAEELGL